MTDDIVENGTYIVLIDVLLLDAQLNSSVYRRGITLSSRSKGRLYIGMHTCLFTN